MSRRYVVVVLWLGDRPSFQAGRGHAEQGQTELRLRRWEGRRSAAVVFWCGGRPSFQAGRSHGEQGQTELRPRNREGVIVVIITKQKDRSVTILLELV